MTKDLTSIQKEADLYSENLDREDYDKFSSYCDYIAGRTASIEENERLRLFLEKIANYSPSGFDISDIHHIQSIAQQALNP